ncbi:hypothetical protein CTI12_AA408990 [Artemisia annua]|uniref:DUF674 domain-containing protein n=1 Tax=Artemisia annua TaxID=35608 RepID=A0A2U1M889_ARTAN|nr:hypothetical protein CTI12_AA408990 [Artemisia annua]
MNPSLYPIKATMASQKMSLKLLVDKSGQKVLFAEANKEFVDFLFHIFSLPLGTLIEFLGSKQMVGCLGKLKDSIQSLNETYIQPGIHKDDIFNPKTPYNGNTLLLANEASSDNQATSLDSVYTCSVENGHNRPGIGHYVQPSYCKKYATLHAGVKCPGCSNYMSLKMTHVIPNTAEAEAVEIKKKLRGGYVKEVVTYMVMDNLVVKPMSTISSISLINSFGVKDLSRLEEKLVSFGKDEALKLLKASLSTDKVLTTLFLHKNYA